MLWRIHRIAACVKEAAEASWGCQQAVDGTGRCKVPEEVKEQAGKAVQASGVYLIYHIGLRVQPLMFVCWCVGIQESRKHSIWPMHMWRARILKRLFAGLAGALAVSWGPTSYGSAKACRCAASKLGSLTWCMCH